MCEELERPSEAGAGREGQGLQVGHPVLLLPSVTSWLYVGQVIMLYTLKVYSAICQ